jgi:hypothetical protein
MTRWSKLQKQLYRLFDPGIRLQVQCRLVRMASGRGSTDLPRYWITLGKETLWDYPGDFLLPGGVTRHADSYETNPWPYPYQTDISLISALIREYIDTPVSCLLTRRFTNDHWGLVNILRAADRRIGVRQWPRLKRKIHNERALKVLAAREQRSKRPAPFLRKTNGKPPVPGL